MITEPLFRGREAKRRRELHEKYMSDPAYVEKQLENKTKRRTLLKQELVEYKGGKCAHCLRSFHPAAMDFHHVDSSSKEKSVAVLLGGSKEKALKEIEKCILLCSNCHRTLHATEQGKKYDY